MGRYARSSLFEQTTPAATALVDVNASVSGAWDVMEPELQVTRGLGSSFNSTLFCYMEFNDQDPTSCKRFSACARYTFQTGQPEPPLQLRYTSTTASLTLHYSCYSFVTDLRSTSMSIPVQGLGSSRSCSGGGRGLRVPHCRANTQAQGLSMLKA